MNEFSNRGSRRRNRRAPAGSELQDSYFTSHGRARRGQKTAQLCRQVFRAVSLALGDCADDVLRELVVHDVEPAPDAGRMLVRVSVSPIAGRDVPPPHEVLARLGEAGGFLRREVAAAITRKRAPELLFTFAPPSTPPADAVQEVPHE